MKPPASSYLLKSTKVKFNNFKGKRNTRILAPVMFKWVLRCDFYHLLFEKPNLGTKLDARPLEIKIDYFCSEIRGVGSLTSANKLFCTVPEC